MFTINIVQRNLFERVHYCGGPVVTKSGYDDGIPWVSKKYSNFDKLNMYCIFTHFSVNFGNILKTIIISECTQICACIYITTEKGNCNNKNDWTPKTEE